MRIIILENGTSTSDYFSRVANIQTDSYESVEELLQNDYSEGNIIIAISQSLDMSRFHEVCEKSLFTVVLTDRPNQINSSKALVLPASTGYDMIVATVKSMTEHIATKRKQSIQPIPHKDYNDGIYETLKKDMLKSAEVRAQELKS